MFTNVHNMAEREGAVRAAFTISEVARLYAVSDSHIRRLIRDGVLHKVPFMGSSVRISPDELERVFGTPATGGDQ